MVVTQYQLTRAWAVIARAGDCVRLTNVGSSPVIMSGTDRQLPAGGSALHAKLPADLTACAAEGSAAIVVEVTPGLSAEP